MPKNNMKMQLSDLENEMYAMKIARTVLKGLETGNGLRLLGGTIIYSKVIRSDFITS